MPPLRERVADLSLLASRMLAELGERYRRSPIHLSADAMTAIENYPWPGNVRQVSNALEFAVVHSEGSIIERWHLLPEVGQASSSSAGRARKQASTTSPSHQWVRVLEGAGGNRAEAARRLGMSRTTLWKFLKRADAQGAGL